MPARAGFEIGGVTVAPGTRRTVDLPVSVLSDHTPVNMSVHVIHGRRAGPTVFISAAVHGDEVIGVEIVRRLLQLENLDRLRGTLLMVPIVNAFGFISHSRYLPDRRDLNRSFPGISHGSLAARLADHFMSHVVARCDLGIDLHSAAVHRTNLPQVRISPDNGEALSLAKAFGAPVVLVSGLRPKSLRKVAKEEHGIDVLLFEAGEALRFDEMSVRAGVSGILRVLHRLKMIPAKGIAKARTSPVICADSSWMRAPAGGLLRIFRSEGDVVASGDVLAAVSDPFGAVDAEVAAEFDGIIVGRTLMPVVNEGDALFHIAEAKSGAAAELTLESLAAQLRSDPLFDEDEII
ncbi:succinylglutamate desuccinylase [Maritimibacter sp. 55A14]|uniref:succinylglutamate desuccinylase/aspartoacylase family protein n=1 Tax=Maritimibacter sp. 55A14 TaxID=2174844 RepID=UPI000D6202C3|nr:succinylglutamate desuccinylase/aspartoacylase family protein [Maritimibacter sp. 55A14]PWE33229.1 succinylglutamate desuccinylase [Maritimibacter sp. 55A14]